jgi:hypothetical protein
MRWAGHLAFMWEMMHPYRVLDGNPEGKVHWENCTLMEGQS